MAARSETKRCIDNFKSEYADTFCRLGEVLLAFSSGLLSLVTFGTSYWLVETVEKKYTHHSGLWQNCSSVISDNPDTSCVTLPLTGASYLISARLFLCVALVVGILAWIISVVGLLQHRARWLFIAAISYAVQVILMLLGLASFAKAFSYNTKQHTFTPSWSYSVGWLAMVISLLCSFYFFSVAVYRIRNPLSRADPTEMRSYAPLAQFESTETGSDDDEDL